VKLDVATLAGLVAAFGFILLGNHLEGGHMSAIVQPTAALIVFGGTLGAVLVSFPMSDFITAVKVSSKVFGNKTDDQHALLQKIVEYAKKARREGIIALEEEAQKIEDPFFKKAMLMVVDGVDSKTMLETLELELGMLDHQGEVPAKVYEAGGGYSPTIGIIGAVLGLIHVMSNLSDVAKVGEGIAVAFVATIYGVAAANIVFLPAANKLKIKHHAEMVQREMIMHGVLAIQQGEKPKLIVDRLSAFIHGHAAAHAAGDGKDKDKGQAKAA
jgi:chemotaxis protein MotA